MSEATDALNPPAEEPVKGGLDALLDSALDGYGNAPVAEPGNEPKSDDRQRDAHGRFIAKDQAEAEPSVQEPAKADANNAEPAAAEPPPEPIQPHARWDAALKTQFATWPRDVQQAFLDRHNAFEGDYTRKTQELAETRKSVEPLTQEVGKWSQYLNQIGLRPEQAFNQLLGAEYTLRTGTPEQKANAISYLCQQYGIRLPTSQGGEGQAQPAFDPAVSQLHQTVSGLDARLRQMTEQRELEDLQRARAEFDAFGQAKDANGQLKYPHFDRVKETLLRLVANGQADSWEAGYNKAVRLDDELWQQSVEAERTTALQAAEKARQEAVEKAKKAQPVKSSDGAPKGGAKLSGLDAHLNAALERSGLAS